MSDKTVEALKQLHKRELVLCPPDEWLEKLSEVVVAAHLKALEAQGMVVVRNTLDDLAMQMIVTDQEAKGNTGSA